MSDKKIFSLKFLFKISLVFGLSLVIFLSNADNAFARRSGGRMGGGSFSRPSRSMPSGGSRSPNSGYRGGGGFGFPLLIPFFGFGGGGLFTLLIFFGIISFIIRAFQNAGFGEGNGYSPTTVSVAQVQVGLLASAKSLQEELNQLALSVDTSTEEGRVKICQEASLALLRHPEYWIYGTAESTEENMDTAEAIFNKLSLMERSKFTEETLSNYENKILTSSPSDNKSDLAKLNPENNDYIMVTILVGVTGNLTFPKINDSQDLRQALQVIGSIGGDRLLTIEVLWTPQAVDDTLSADDILTYYPDLRLL